MIPYNLWKWGVAKVTY